jgi:hypothetical protein
MKGTRSVLVASVLVGAAAAESSPGYVRWDIQKRTLPSTVVRRAATSGVEVIGRQGVANFPGDYFADVTVGNPPQNMSLLLDTGSADTWVLDSNNERCKKKGFCSFGTCQFMFLVDGIIVFTDRRCL